MTQNGEASKNKAKGAVAKPATILGALDLFIERIDSLAETLPLTMVSIQLAHMVTHHTYRKFIEEHCETINSDGDEYIKIEPTRMYPFEKLDKRLTRIAMAERTVPESFVVSLVSHYDYFLGRLIKSL